ncbi:MAG: 23S rRNA (uracil(1939)-C(5))-methyltransferase RlmD [Balneolaceae bacterium]
MSIRKGEQIELTIDRAAFKGKGVGRFEGIAVFVPGTAPGDRVRAQITKKKKSFCEGKLLEITEPSPRRIQPTCIHANVCGGCTWQHLSYEDQTEIKEQQVRDHMTRIAKLNGGLVQPIIGCEEPFHYRNKMEYSFSVRRWLSEEEIRSEEFVDDRGLAAGLHAPGRFDKILNLKECYLQEPDSFRMLDEVRSFCQEHGIEAYDTYQQSGYIRHLVLRNGRHTGEWMVNLVTNSDNSRVAEAMKTMLLERFPGITTIVNNINDQPSPTTRGRYENVLHGPGYITDRIGEFTFRIHSDTFFQTNTLQAEKLYEVALHYSLMANRGLVYDLYCGVGTLSLWLSREFRRVVGIELSETSIASAKKNADGNAVENCEFLPGDMKDTFNDALLEQTGRPDCIVTDPPRAGMHPDVVRQLKELKVPVLVYVSCNPSTLARDLEMLSEVYEVQSIQPVDMFPQTYHIEAVTQLTLKPETTASTPPPCPD